MMSTAESSSSCLETKCYLICIIDDVCFSFDHFFFHKKKTFETTEVHLPHLSKGARTCAQVAQVVSVCTFVLVKQVNMPHLCKVARTCAQAAVVSVFVLLY